MIAHQLSVPLMTFLLHHRDGLSIVDILGEPFCKQTKEFQAEYLRISMIHDLLKQGHYRDAFKAKAESDETMTPQKPLAFGGDWI